MSIVSEAELCVTAIRLGLNRMTPQQYNRILQAYCMVYPALRNWFEGLGDRWGTQRIRVFGYRSGEVAVLAADYEDRRGVLGKHIPAQRFPELCNAIAAIHYTVESYYGSIELPVEPTAHEIARACACWEKEEELHA